MRASGFYFLWLLRESLGFLFYSPFSFITLGIPFVAGTAIFIQREAVRPRLPDLLRLVAIQVFLYFFIVLVGAAGANSGNHVLRHESASEAGYYALISTNILAIAVSIYTVARNRGIRWSAALLSLFFIYALQFAFAIAGMSISGKWL